VARFNPSLFKKKPTLLLTIGTAVALMAGGATAWWLLQHTPISELPVGADVLPQDTAVSFSFTSDPGQWRRLRQYGTVTTQASFDRSLANWRDRLFAQNGIDYGRDIQPWVGQEITVAFLNPPPLDAELDQAASGAERKDSGKAILPYRPPNDAEFDRSAVMILPIADAEKARQLMSTPRVNSNQEWGDRDYHGVMIREVHGQTQLDYAVALLDNRFVVTSGDVRSIEQIIDAARDKKSVAQNSDYGRAFSQLREEVANPFMRLYVNVPAATEFSSANANQPVPPQLLSLMQNNQGLAAAMTLESDGIRLRGDTWIASNSRTRLQVNNDAERLPVLLPTESVLVATGDNLKEFWRNYSQPPNHQSGNGQTEASQPPPARLLSASSIQQNFRNLTGLDWDKDIIAWTGGEFALSLLSAPATSAGTSPTAGLLLMAQASDRRAADEAFTKLDQAMQERNGWQVKPGELEGRSVVTWTSPFAALTVTRGWLDGNIVYLAVGTGVAEAIVPAPTQPLVNSNLFRNATATDLEDRSGHFFMAVDQLANPNISLPVPNLPQSQRDTLGAIRAIGLTTAVQDNRTTQFDMRVLTPRSDKTPAALPSAAPPAPALDTPAPAIPESAE
jgi:hypothetical protein